MVNLKTKQKGAIGEHAVALDLLKRGFRVLKPINEDSPYDYLVDIGNGRFIKIQVKLRNNWFVPKNRVWSDARGRHTSKYTSDEVDVIAMTDIDTLSIAYIPLEMAGISLKEQPSGSWRYLKEDFNLFPCAERYERKLKTSKGKIIGEFLVEECMANYDDSKTTKENADRYGVPKAMVYKLRKKVGNAAT